MERFRIPFSRYPTPPVKELVMTHTGVDGPGADLMLYQGCVWHAQGYTKVRIRDPHFSLKDGELDIFKPSFPIFEYTLDEQHILFEDDDLLAIYKIPNLNTVQSPFSDLDCLVHGVQKYLLKNGSTYHVNAVHRLDLPAQGIVLFGKNKESEKILHRMFMNRRVKKLYLAETPLFDAPSTPLRIHDEISWREKTQEAWSFIKLIEQKTDKMVFAASPLTGRTHQLRIHFQKYLKPILGDVLYGPYQLPEELRLASVYYRFRHPKNGKLMELVHIPKSFELESFPCQRGSNPLS